jgi:hypothetical protein
MLCIALRPFPGWHPGLSGASYAGLSRPSAPPPHHASPRHQPALHRPPDARCRLPRIAAPAAPGGLLGRPVRRVGGRRARTAARHQRPGRHLRFRARPGADPADAGAPGHARPAREPHAARGRIGGRPAQQAGGRAHPVPRDRLRPALPGARRAGRPGAGVCAHRRCQRQHRAARALCRLPGARAGGRPGAGHRHDRRQGRALQAPA